MAFGVPLRGEGSTLLLILVLAIPQGCFSVCVFGANNTGALATRNSTIVKEMEGILNQLFENATLKTLAVSDFNLSAHMDGKYGVTTNNILNFVSYGRLLRISWNADTKGTTANVSLPNFIMAEFVNPVHNALQTIAVKYSFSYGIFRPKLREFYFTGLNLETLDTTCLAGSLIVLQIVLNITHQDVFTDYKSKEFATLATMLENKLDLHLRGARSSYTNDFVRANVLNETLNPAKSTMLMNICLLHVECYFFNESRNATELASYLASLLIQMTYDDGNKRVDAITARFKGIGAWNISSLNITSTFGTTVLTTEHTTVLQTTIMENTTSTLLQSTTSSALSIESSTATELLVQAVAYNSTTNPPNITSTASQLIDILPKQLTTSVPTDLTYMSKLNNATATVSTISIAQTTNAFTIASLQNSTDNLNTTLLQNISDSSNGTSQAANTTTTGFNMRGNTSTVDPSLVGNTFTAVPLTKVSTSNVSSLQGNSTTQALPKNGTNATDSNGANTFDPDPWFQAVVPVVTKVYNDRVLMKQVGSVAPLLEKAVFYSITIPTAIGMVMAIVGCLLCLQTEWLARISKV